jgi:hypothetical protein
MPMNDKDELAVTETGLVTHARWLNPDGSYKEGRTLEVELLKVELENISRRLLRLVQLNQWPTVFF